MTDLDATPAPTAGRAAATWTSVEVAASGEEAPGLRTLRLVRCDAGAFEPVPPGAHVDVETPGGLVRQYSPCGDPADTASILIAVKLENPSRGGSSALHTLRVGDRLRVGAVRTLLPLAAADRYLLIGAGIGITPLLSLAHALHAAGRPFDLHYVVRSRAQAAFLPLLEEQVPFRRQVVVHAGVPRADLPARLAPAITRLTRDGHVYTCGPAGFMSTVRDLAAPRVGDAHVHVELFTTPDDAGPGDVTGLRQGPRDVPFVVALTTGEEFEVPAGESMLTVLQRNGIDVFASCQEGICGSCVSRVVEGVPEHRDHCLTLAERKSGEHVALCVSPSQTPRLVVELL